jgi:hypothetical protein
MYIVGTRCRDSDWLRAAWRRGRSSSSGSVRILSSQRRPDRLWGLLNLLSNGYRGLFLRVLRFPLPILILPTAAHSSSSIIRGWRETINSYKLILSRARGCVTNNCGFWMWWLGLFDVSITNTLNYTTSHIVCVLSYFNSELWTQSESYVTTDGQSASLSWNKAPIWGWRADFYYCLTVAGLLIWGALSNERTGPVVTGTCSVNTRCLGNQFPIWLHNSGFHASRHNIKKTAYRGPFGSSGCRQENSAGSS